MTVTRLRAGERSDGRSPRLSEAGWRSQGAPGSNGLGGGRIRRGPRMGKWNSSFCGFSIWRRRYAKWPMLRSSLILFCLIWCCSISATARLVVREKRSDHGIVVLDGRCTDRRVRSSPPRSSKFWHRRRGSDTRWRSIGSRACRTLSGSQADADRRGAPMQRRCVPRSPL